MTLTLNRCAREGCNPVEQSRGQMKPEDHHRQFARQVAAEQFVQDHGVGLPIEEFRQDAFEVEDQGPEHNSDIRISCSKCGKATGWDRRDREEFKRHGDGDYRRHVVVRDGNVETLRERWNDMVK